MSWLEKRVLVTGGASFLGSTLVDALVVRDARVRVVDNLTSGRLDNLRQHLAAASIEFVEADLHDPVVAGEAVEGIDLVFHLAGSHDRCASARGRRPACSANLLLDGGLFRACSRAGIEKVIFVSSAENGIASEAGNVCAWTRRTAELTLGAYAAARQMKAASCRYFSVYGPRTPAHHTLMGLIGRVIDGEDPLVISGDGQRMHRWTHVDDVVTGVLLAAERIDDGTTVDLLTPECVQEADGVLEVTRCCRRAPRIELTAGRPLTPAASAPDSSSFSSCPGWVPAVTFASGLPSAIDWYRAASEDQVAAPPGAPQAARARSGSGESWPSAVIV